MNPSETATLSQLMQLQTGIDTMFLLLGAVMVLAMHAGFAFLELGTVRQKVSSILAVAKDDQERVGITRATMPSSCALQQRK